MIFVFGSNLAGRHGAGAALFAKKHHGAVNGIGLGLQGNSYAIPTKDARLVSLPVSVISINVEFFKSLARMNHETGFQITRIGCGLAGYKDEEIAPLFRDAPKQNCFFDTAWRPFLGNEFEYWGTFST